MKAHLPSSSKMTRELLVALRRIAAHSEHSTMNVDSPAQHFAS